MKLTKVEIAYIKDIDIYMFIEKAIRGGLVSLNKRYTKANNELISNYDPTKPNVYLQHWDINNLYGKSLSEMLPLSHFEWASNKEIEAIDWKTINTEIEIGYIIECDLIYPSYLHEYHSDFPLAPVKQKISNNELSNWQNNNLDYLKNFGFRRSPTEKLMLTLDNKIKYTLHFKNLKLYLELGLKLDKIHRVLKFYQTDFLKQYIKLNTDMRKKKQPIISKKIFIN